MQKLQTYQEQMNHQTYEIPIALHRLEYPTGTDTLFYLHWHKEFEFFIVTEGYIDFTIEDRNYRLAPGDCLFINTNFYHSAKAVQGNHCRFVALDFSYEFLDGNIDSCFSSKYICPLVNGQIVFPELIQIIDFPDDSWQNQIISYLQEICRYDDKALVKHELLIKSRIYLIWEVLFQNADYRNKENNKEFAQKSRLAPVLEYIHQYYADEIKLADLSDMLYISKNHFCRIFNEAMNCTPYEYLIRYRILRSCSLLLETDKKIGEIASLSGFNNISYYNRVFFKTIGCTPKQYRSFYSQ